MPKITAETWNDILLVTKLHLVTGLVLEAALLFRGCVTWITSRAKTGQSGAFKTLALPSTTW